MYIPQKQLENLSRYVKPGKAVVIFGPRRTGKTTLVKKFLANYSAKYLFVTGEDINIREYLSSESIEKLKSFIGSNKLVVIDEAQKIPQIGLNIKLIIDHLPEVAVIATGSSAFDLARNLGEPLTGRKYTLKQYPLAQLEIAQIENLAETNAHLEDRLIYGSYPEVVIESGREERQIYLKDIVQSYLYKDILELDGLRYAHKIVQLLQLLAFQIGKEVSYSELATQLGFSKNTVEKYLDLLEKNFVVYRLTGFSRNLRKELRKSHRYYFYDNGIRNALINNFNTISVRDDIGMLWENYLISERLKKQEYHGLLSNNYFWRTYDQQEIDFIEERAGKLFGYEMKWKFKKVKPPKSWLDAYPNSEFVIISPENYLDFIT
ncbi:MAG: AAA family ATPase [Candidatus Magasanikbacteria bacterium RIFCSPHIGHO2_01_FULL_41_23]|uniref:AAA family ATPase n=1 Tax=Candidatus Magasanikbacteria bacterium RIFCSPLOWO2_01_FULL_40_15 TaxID=1798686 RepID=A0A1F6N4L1_9BACT|nr:MAG: AAA family ATPase [Candidatus Magasanikbacteria bacterium RIFCSPHIGHO2_01_FULL_41_23]OGH66782.1 MAG: AAA family ATPase [Candidatus Magasanikbacteria bacterium RIFCSPHIGHO2_02_FULL_41_35]OGH74580.1 MAG: AAA family ATPase [Candidatus Magasanikbacteria bacterium RIFCSPHIGHO2_12_FULL_41_16]OGH78869.1 MAG: AAA family ATPase [Candidatus Magasanikbacteria bacterium RIFCSPLOWO2_01_FULL_40_15]